MPHVFSVIGDCQSSPTYFLSLYDEDRYTLPEGEEYLEETIEWYAGSFVHRSITVENGMTVASALNPMWARANSELCETTETPIACEVRLSNPTLALISLGTNWTPSTSQEDYIAYLNQIVDILLEQGVLPVLSTKADNTEGDYSRNLAMARWPMTGICPSGISGQLCRTCPMLVWIKIGKMSTSITGDGISATSPRWNCLTASANSWQRPNNSPDDR